MKTKYNWHITCFMSKSTTQNIFTKSLILLQWFQYIRKQVNITNISQQVDGGKNVKRNADIYIDMAMMMIQTI